MSRQIAHSAQSHQETSTPQNLSHYWVSTPSASTVAWNAPVQLNFVEKGVIAHEFIVAITLPAVSGLGGTPVTNYPNFNNANSFITKADIKVGNSDIDTLNMELNYLKTQLYSTNEDRETINVGTGGTTLAQRNANAIKETIYYIPLSCFINQSHFKFLQGTNSDVSIKLQLNTLANVINVSTLTGTAVCPVLAVNLLTRCTKLPQELITQSIQSLVKRPELYRFNSTSTQNYPLQSGITNFSAILSTFAGQKINVLYFVVRPTAALTNLTQYEFVEIKNFHITNSSGTSLVGGSFLDGKMNMVVQSNAWSASTFLCESYTASATKSFVYQYSFSASPTDNHKTAGHYTSYLATGSDILNINFVSALSGSHSLDIFASCSNAISNIHKIIPKIENIDLAELMLNVGVYFAVAEHWQKNVKLLLEMHNIVVEDFPAVYSVIKKFLTQITRV